MATEPPHPAEDEADWKRRSVNLKRIGLALHNYHDANGHFPPSAIVDKNGRPLLSWRVAILPFLELEGEGVKGSEGLYKQFRLDEPWDSPHNKALLPKMPAPYRWPSMKVGSDVREIAAVRRAFGQDVDAMRRTEDERSRAIERYHRQTGKMASAEYEKKKRELRELTDANATFYRALVGKGAAFEDERGVRFQELTDGVAKTMMVAEAETPVPWTKPEELACSPDSAPPRLGAPLHDGFAVLFADGRVQYVDKRIDVDSLRAMITRNGGETVDAHEHLHNQPPSDSRRTVHAFEARTLEEALGLLRGRLSKEGQAEYAPLLTEERVRKAVLVATQRLGDRLRKQGEADPATWVLFQQSVEPVFLAVGGRGTWSRGC
ncbi:DUF1559 family PulG-like putative transporter, partial [Singulisphaera rosea]